MTIIEEMQALENKKKNAIVDLLKERDDLESVTALRLKAITEELKALGHKRQRKAKGK